MLPKRHLQRVGVLFVLVLVAVACAAHPVGPARTYSSYEAKARTTADSVRSSVATVRLLVEAAGDGNVFGTYASVTVSEQEDALLGTEGTFGSIQPPGVAADEVRRELLDLIGDAAEHVTAVRVEIRRGNLDDLERFAATLAADEAALTAFLDAHGAKD